MTTEDPSNPFDPPADSAADVPAADAEANASAANPPADPAWSSPTPAGDPTQVHGVTPSAYAVAEPPEEAAETKNARWSTPTLAVVAGLALVAGLLVGSGATFLATRDDNDGRGNRVEANQGQTNDGRNGTDDDDWDHDGRRGPGNMPQMPGNGQGNMPQMPGNGQGNSSGATGSTGNTGSAPQTPSQVPTNPGSTSGNGG